MTVAARGVGKGMGQCSLLTRFLHTPYPAPPCILLLLERIDLTGEARVTVDVTGHGLDILSHVAVLVGL